MYASADRPDLAPIVDETHGPNLALCLIEAVQATVADASIVVDRYSAYRRVQGHSTAADGVRALLRTFEEAGSCDQWAGKVGNYRRCYSPASAPIAASAIVHAAEFLYAHHIDSMPDLRRVLRDYETATALQAGLSEISGKSEAWFTFLQLTGMDRSLALVSA